MNTLSRQFPLVQCVTGASNDNVSELVQPYLNWQMVTVDDYSSVLLTKHEGKISGSTTSDLVILIGDVAKEWFSRQLAQSGD